MSTSQNLLHFYTISDNLLKLINTDYEADSFCFYAPHKLVAIFNQKLMLLTIVDDEVTCYEFGHMNI